MMSEFSGHDPCSFKKPVVVRRSPSPTYLGVIDTSRDPAVWLVDNDPTSDYLAKAADTTLPQDGGVHTGRKNVFGKVIVPWELQTGFPEIQFCDEDGEDNERELAGLKLLQCPTRSKRYLKMCQKADEKEHGYAQELNTATLLHWQKVVLWALHQAEEGGATEVFSSLVFQRVDEAKLLESLYQPMMIVESIVGSLNEVERAGNNLRCALRSLNLVETFDLPFASTNTRRPFATSSFLDSLTGDANIPGSQETDAQSWPYSGLFGIPTSFNNMQGSQAASTKIRQSSTPLLDSVRQRYNFDEVFGNNKPGIKTTAPSKPAQKPSNDASKSRKTIDEAKLGKPQRQTHSSGKSQIVDLTQNASKSRKPAGTAHQSKKRKQATVESDDEETK